ncbi:MAG: DUF6345 domain-containing protein [Candidatus Thorarchaeota archaeon]
MVFSVSSETATTHSTVTIEKPDFVLSQVEMPVYEIIPPEVNLTYAEDMAYALFGFRDSSAQDVEGKYVVRSGNKTFEMDSRDGSMWFADYDLLYNIALGIAVPTPTACRDQADAWLDEKGLRPPNYVFVNMGSTNVTAWNIDAGGSNTKVIQWHVNYEMFLGENPVKGPGEQITVMIGEGGEIAGFNWNHRELKAEPYATEPIIEYDSILEHYGLSPDDVVNHELVYYAESSDESNLLKPYYELVINDADDGEDIFQIIQIAAFLIDPEVEIVSPGHYLTFTQYEDITFECVVTNGLGPFVYYWYSDFDGLLSVAQNFSTSSLTIVDKKGVPVPHTIHVRVKDSLDRWCMDYIAVFIEAGTISTFPTTLTIAIAAGSLIVVVGAAILLLKRRGAMVLMLFLIVFSMLLSAFTIMPIVDATNDLHDNRVFSPSAPTGAYDDGVKEVGIEWCGISVWKPLWNTETNIEGFYSWMGVMGGYSQEFNWGEYSAWEEDFKDEAYGGTDSEWVDAVDFVYYQDHGGPDGVTFRTNNDDKSLLFRECRWGDGDLDTIAIDACSPLAWENSTGHNVFERWADTLQGIHMVCGFSTTSHNARTRGTKFGTYMTGFGASPALTIKDAWFRACAETEGSDILSAVFYASKSSNPLNPQQDDPVNDHAYGFGYVCSDPIPGTFGWYVFITSNC